jgi:LmbE family N-acetylglucosaminyl deacetylase
MSKKRTLLAIFAHPDDEAFGTGGTLTKYAAEGVDVHLIMATSGDAGQISRAELATMETIAQVREEELRAACRHYGINPPHLLRFPDGQTTVVNQKEAVEKIVALIRQLQPQVILTFGPEGVYGHYDHIAVHRWTTIAVRLAADPEWFPAQLENGSQPHNVAKVYHRATPQERIDDMYRHNGGYVMMDGVPFPFVGFTADEITTIIDTGAYAEQKLAGILCHATQIDPKRFNLDDNPLQQRWLHEETFIRAKSLVPVSEGVERDLFCGLDD